MTINRFEVTTDDPEIGNQMINDVYGSGRAMRFWGASSDFRFHLSTNSAGVVSADRLTHSMAAGAVTDPFDSFIVARVTSGVMHFAHEGEEVAMRAGDFGRYPTSGALVCNWDTVDVEIVRIPLDLVDAVAAPESDGAPVIFHSMRAVSPAAAARWTALSRFLHNTLTGAGSPAEAPIVQQQLGETVAAMALTVFPNTVMTRSYVQGAGYVGPASMRRATQFIDEHAIEPLTLSEIAAAAGVSPRALQAAFRRHWAMSPMAYLRQTRLERAHRELQAADPASGATVTATAVRWGFAEPDRFARAYRARFATLPSHTLEA